jgi:hypothetical protein
MDGDETLSSHADDSAWLRVLQLLSLNAASELLPLLGVSFDRAVQLRTLSRTILIAHAGPERSEGIQNEVMRSGLASDLDLMQVLAGLQRVFSLPPAAFQNEINWASILQTLVSASAPCELTLTDKARLGLLDVLRQTLVSARDRARLESAEKDFQRGSVSEWDDQVNMSLNLPDGMSAIDFVAYAARILTAQLALRRIASLLAPGEREALLEWAHRMQLRSPLRFGEEPVTLQ